jgi:hypothetical protein
MKTYRAPAIVILLALLVALVGPVAAVAASGRVLPEIVGQIGGSSYAVAVQGDYAYLGVGPRLVVLDISDPSDPTMLGQTDIMGDVVQGVAVAGGYAYVAAEYAGLQVVDVSDPSDPRLVGSCDTPSRARDVAVAAGYAYVADWTTMQVMDISDPTNPHIAGALVTSGEVEALAVAGTYAYLAGRGLTVADISTPTTPQSVGTLATAWFAEGVDVEGSYAYVAAYEYGLQVLDVSNPAAPSVVGSCDTPGLALDARVAGGYAFLAVGNIYNTAGDTNAMVVVDVSQPVSPWIVACAGSLAEPQALTLDRSNAYVAGPSFGLQVFEVSDPSSPATAASWDPAFSAQSVEVEGNSVYVGSLEGLHIVGATDLTMPQVRGFLALEDTAEDVALANGYAYVANSWRGLRVVDVLDPTAPRSVAALSLSGSYGHPTRPIGVTVDGSHVFVAAGWDGWAGPLHVVSIVDPLNPSVVGTCYTPGMARNVAVGNNLAFVADYDEGLQVLDVSDSTSPEIIGSRQTWGNAEAIVADGEHVYVANVNAGMAGPLQIVDISDPTNPQIMSNGGTLGNYAYGIAVASGFAYLASGFDGLEVVEVTDPEHPEIAGTSSMPGRVKDIAVAGDYAFAAAEEGGILVFRLVTSGTVSADGGSLVSASGNTSLSFASDVFTDSVAISYHPVSSNPEAERLLSIGHTFEISAVYTATGQPAQPAPGQNYTMTVAYGGRDTDGLIEDTLALYYWNGSRWVMEPTSVVDTANQTITVTPDHFSLWAVMGEPWQIYLPVLHRFR